VNDLGKMAATFADVKTGRVLRISPGLDIRERAWSYAPGETQHYFAQLAGYQVMPEAELLRFQEVKLRLTLEELISQPLARALCERCGEEIFNEREVKVNGTILCRTCAQEGYYLLQTEGIGAITDK